jgi:peptidoglycan/xylan/chitin deacetylase (PgdA/CDA1 family)
MLSNNGRILKSSVGKYLRSAQAIPPTPVTTPAVIFTFDDGGETLYDEAFSYMSGYNMKGVGYLCKDFIGGVGIVTLSEMAEMYSAGWDMANHSVSHTNFTTLTQAQIEAELLNNATYLENNGFPRAARHVAYPFGDYDADTLAAMSATDMLTGRNVLSGLLPFPLTDAYELTCFNCHNTITLAQAITQIDNTISQNKVIIFLLHNITASPGADDWSISKFQSLIDYVSTADISVITMSEYYNGVLL